MGHGRSSYPAAFPNAAITANPTNRIAVATNTGLVEAHLNRRAQTSHFDIAASDCDLVKTLAALDVSTPVALGACFRSLRDRGIRGFILLRDGKRAWRLRRC
jgi:hypothetical protein